MAEFETNAVEHLRARGVDPRTVEEHSLRLEPFGGAFLLRFDGAVVVSVREVHELLGVTVDESTRETINCECGHGRTLHMGAPGRSPWCNVDGCPCLVFVASGGKQ